MLHFTAFCFFGFTACRLFETLYYMNQCWLIINWTLRNKHQWNWNPDENIFCQQNSFKNICEMAAILYRPFCVVLTLRDFYNGGLVQNSVGHLIPPQPSGLRNRLRRILSARLYILYSGCRYTVGQLALISCQERPHSLPVRASSGVPLVSSKSYYYSL